MKHTNFDSSRVIQSTKPEQYFLFYLQFEKSERHRNSGYPSSTKVKEDEVKEIQTVRKHSIFFVCCVSLKFLNWFGIAGTYFEDLHLFDILNF